MRALADIEIIGMDLSLRRSALVGLRDSSLEDARVVVIEPEGLDGVARIVEIVRQVKEFVSYSPSENVHAYVEQHAFHMATGSYALERAELVGAVKVALATRGIAVCPVVASSARKLFFGKLPRMKREVYKKFLVHEFGKLGLGERFPKDDECDAALIANWGHHDQGRVANSLAP